MGRIDNLADVWAEMKKLQANVAKLGAANPLASSSLTHGRLRIGGDAILLVDSSGGLVVHGSINGDGTITWSGVFKLTGTTSFEGDTTQKGPFHVQGNSDFTGTVSINGLATLLKNLNVTGGGKITVGNMVLDPAIGGSGVVGGISAPAVIFLDAPSVVVNHGLQVNDNLAAEGGVIMANLPTTTNAANLNVSTPFGTIGKVSSASRFKLDVELMDLPDALVDNVRVVDWVDKGQHEHGEDGARVPGVIAEDVAAAGGDLFVTYDAEGVIEGVAYDRLAMARTQVLADRLSVAAARIEQLERRLEEQQS